jgi:hypothetical protein
VSRRRLLAPAVVAASAVLSPLGAQAHGSSQPVSQIWRAVDGALVDFQDFPRFRVIRSVFELRGDPNSEKAYLFIRWREGRFSTRKAATCAGLRYVGKHVVDTRVRAGEGWFGLANGEGKAHLTITRRLSIFERSTLIGPPVCVETTGKWFGSSGFLSGTGTFRFNNDLTLIFRP